MASITKLRGMSGGIPTTLDLTSTSDVFQFYAVQIDVVTASKPAKFDSNKQFTSGDINLTSEVTGSLPDSNLATITTGNKVSGSAVQLSGDSTIVNDTGLEVGTNLANANIDASAAIAVSKLAALTASRAVVSDGSGFISASSVTSTEIGYVSGSTSNIQTQLNALSSGYSRRKMVLDYIVDNTAVPPTEVSGDRYILSHDGGSPHAEWDGAAVGDIVEFNGATWDDTTPQEGWRLYDDDSNQDYLWVDDGTGQWEARAIDSQALSDGKVWIGDASNDAQEKTLSGDVTISNTGVAAIGSGVIVNDDVNASAAIVESKLSLDYATGTLNTSITNHTGDGTIHFTMLDEDDLTSDSDTQAATQQSIKAYVDSAVSGAAPDSLDFSRVAGESFAANSTFIVRYAISGDTAGRVYKCTSDEENAAGKHYAIGAVQTTGAISVADPVIVIKFQQGVTLKSGDTVIGASSADQGKPIFLNKAGVMSLDPDAGITTGEKYASRIVGILEEYNATSTSEKITIDIAAGSFFGIDLGA